MTPKQSQSSSDAFKMLGKSHLSKIFNLQLFKQKKKGKKKQPTHLHL